MPTSDYAPTTTDVARLLRARTRDDLGNEVGDFVDGQTTPSATDATALIAEATDEVSDAIGADIPPDYFAGAKRVVTLLAAANVELSYYPEQAAQNNSMYDKLMTRYNTALGTLVSDIEEETEEEAVVQETVDPSGGFPAPLGWGSVQW